MEKQKKKNALYYLNYKNLSAEIEGYHASISVKQTLLWYLVYVGICIAVGFLLKMTIQMIVITGLLGMFFVPILIVNTYKNAYEQRRFSDISQYMEQFLYSFRASGKISTTLEDVKTLFDESNPIVSCIDEALLVLNSATVKGNATRQALEIIEKEYFCDKLLAIHKFAEKVEETGGEYNQSVDLLLEDRSYWVDRTLLLQNEKKKQKRNVVGSILVTIFMCAVMTLLMPTEVDITKSMIYQIGAMVMLVIDFIIYTATDKRLATDWLERRDTVSEKVTMERYQYVTTYDEKKERMKSLKYLLIPVLVFLVGYMFNVRYLYLVALALVPIMLFQHKINYALAMRALKKEINLKFSRWLMDIALLLQITNVQNAIFQSIETAPAVLVPELEKFKEQLQRDPISPEPYLNFMGFFKLAEVQASMKMLYSIDQGAGGEASEQIAEIIRRNNKMLDKVEGDANDDSLAVMYMYFLLPQLSAGMMVLVEMVLYIVMYLPVMSKM